MNLSEKIQRIALEGVAQISENLRARVNPAQHKRRKILNEITTLALQYVHIIDKQSALQADLDTRIAYQKLNHTTL